MVARAWGGHRDAWVAVQRGERKEPEKANVPALSGHIPDTRVQVLRHSDKLISL